MKEDITNYMQIEKHRRNVHVSFKDLRKLNIFFSESLKYELFDLINKPRTNLILNLNGIHFIDTSAFSTLAFVAKSAQIFGSRLVLSNVNDELMELIELVQKFSDFNIYRISEQKEEQLLMAG